MKTIKLYWHWIVAAIIGLVGILTITQTQRTNRKLKKTAKKIGDNKQQFDELQGKTIILDEQSDLLVTAIDEQKTKIEQLESEPIKVEPTTAKNAKQNILNKQAELKAEHDSKNYQRQRANEYPDLKEYLDGIVKGDDAQIQKYINDCLAVKAKYPKN